MPDSKINIEVSLSDAAKKLADAASGVKLSEKENARFTQAQKGVGLALSAGDIKTAQKNINLMAKILKDAIAGTGSISEALKKAIDAKDLIEKQLAYLKGQKKIAEAAAKKGATEKDTWKHLKDSDDLKKVKLAEGKTIKSVQDITDFMNSVAEVINKRGGITRVQNKDLVGTGIADRSSLFALNRLNNEAISFKEGYVAEQTKTAAGYDEQITAGEQELAQVIQDIESLQKASETSAAALEQLYIQITNIAQGANKNVLDAQTKEATDNIAKQQTAQTSNVDLTSIGTQTQKTSTTLGKAFKQFSVYAVMLRSIKAAAREAVATIKELDKSLTEQAMVTGKTRKQTYALLGTYQDLAAQTGATTKEIAGLATQFMRQGKTTEDALTLTRAAMDAAKVAGISAADSVNYLTTALNGFQMSAQDAMKVSDKFAAIAANSATSYDEIATALSKVASQANLAGMSIDYTTALLAKGLETTREAPETMGTALKTVIARMREIKDYGATLEGDTDVNNVESQLSYIGIALRDNNGELRSTEDVLDELGKKWDTLNSNQQAAVAKALAGTRQQSRLIAMMTDYERVIELQEISQRSQGATMAQMETYLQGMDAALNRVRIAYESIITALGNNEMLTGLINFVAGFLEQLTSNIPLIISGFAILGTLGANALVMKVQEWAATLKQQQASKDLAKQEAEARLAQAQSDQKHLKNMAQEVRTKKVLTQETLTGLKAKVAELKADGKNEAAKALEDNIKAIAKENAAYEDQALAIEKAADEAYAAEVKIYEQTVNQLNPITKMTSAWSNFGENIKSVATTALQSLRELKTAFGKTQKASETAGQAGAGQSASYIPVIGWIIWAIIMGASVLGAVTSAIAGFIGQIESSAEKVNKLSSNIYKMTEKANAIQQVVNSYEDLDKQIIKTKEDQEKLNELLAQGSDKLSDEEKEAYNAMTDTQKITYLKQIKAEALQQANADRQAQLKLLNKMSPKERNAILKDTSNANNLNVQSAIYAMNNNSLYEYIDTLKDANQLTTDQAQALEKVTQKMLETVSATEAYELAQNPERIQKLTDKLREHTDALEVLASATGTIKERTEAYDEISKTLTGDEKELFKQLYSDIDTLNQFDQATKDWMDNNHLTADGINTLGKAINKLGYNTQDTTNLLEELFETIDKGSDVQSALYRVFGPLSDDDYKNLLNAYASAFGTGMLNMGQNITKLDNQIANFYENAGKWNSMNANDKYSFMADNAELFKGTQGEALLKALESGDYNVLEQALKQSKLSETVAEQLAAIDRELAIENARLAEERDYAYIAQLEKEKARLQDTENIYKASLEVRLEQERKYLADYKDYLSAQKDALDKSLNDRKDAYQNYFDAVNQEAEEEDFEEKESTMIANLSKLASSSSADAINKTAELEQQLANLEKERLQTLREQAQEQVLSNIDDEIKEISDKFDELLNSQQALLAAMRGDLDNPAEFFSNLIANKMNTEGLTALGLESYIQELQGTYGSIAGASDVLGALEVKESGNQLILNVAGKEIVLSDNDQQSVYTAIMQALQAIGQR